MDVVLFEIERALATRLYYLAIATTLSLPDICAALESPNGTTSKLQYVAWANQWFHYTRLTSDDLYSLRCGVVHQGQFGHPNMAYSRVLFTIPTPENAVFHNIIIMDALNLDAVTFCTDMIQAARDWYAAKQNDQVVVNNLPRLIQFRPDGLLPYMTGMPLIS